MTILASSGDKAVQLGTLALVGVSGLGSFFQGQQISSQVHEDRDKAIREIHALYQRVDDFEHRQLSMLDNQTRIINNNKEQLANQGTMLNNQQQFLQMLRRNQEDFLKEFHPKSE